MAILKLVVSARCFKLNTRFLPQIYPQKRFQVSPRGDNY